MGVKIFLPQWILCLDLTVSLTQPRIILEKNLSEGLSKLGYPCACLWTTVLIKLTDVGIPSPLWAAVFPRQRTLNCLEGEGVELGINKRESEIESIHCSLLLIYGCDMTSCSKFLPSFPQLLANSSKLLFVRVFNYNQVETKTQGNAYPLSHLLTTCYF